MHRQPTWGLVWCQHSQHLHLARYLTSVAVDPDVAPVVTLPHVESVGLGLVGVERAHALVPASGPAQWDHLRPVHHLLAVAMVTAKVVFHFHWVLDRLVDSLGWWVGALIALHAWLNLKRRETGRKYVRKIKESGLKLWIKCDTGAMELWMSCKGGVMEGWRNCEVRMRKVIKVA